jgi:hypothetical protein
MAYNENLHSIRTYPKEYLQTHYNAPQIDENFGTIAPYQNNTDKYKVFGEYQGKKLTVNDVNRLIDLDRNKYCQEDLRNRLYQEPFIPNTMDLYILLDQRTRTESRFDPKQSSSLFNRKEYPDFRSGTRQNQF